MGATGGIMFGVKSIAELFGASKEASAQKAQAAYQQHMMEVNAKLAEGQAEDTIKAGALEANKLGKKAEAVRGAQRASYAAQGIDVNTGTAAAVQSETDALSKLDELTIKSNAWRQAWGYKVEALNSRSKGQMARIAGDNAAGLTLLTGGIKAFDSLTKGVSTAAGMG